AVMHCPLDGLVWQIPMVSGNFADAVLAAAVIVPPAPTLTVATANGDCAAVTCRMPSFLMVAASATTSGVGVVDPESSRLLSPILIGAGDVLMQEKVNGRSVGTIVAVGVSP